MSGDPKPRRMQASRYRYMGGIHSVEHDEVLPGPNRDPSDRSPRREWCAVAGCRPVEQPVPPSELMPVDADGSVRDQSAPPSVATCEATTLGPNPYRCALPKHTGPHRDRSGVYWMDEQPLPPPSDERSVERVLADVLAVIVDAVMSDEDGLTGPDSDARKVLAALRDNGFEVVRREG